MVGRAPKHREQPKDPLFTTAEAADFLRMPVVTLEQWRRRRRKDGSRPGPEFIRIERRVRYRLSALDAYLAERAAASRATAS